MPSPSLADPTRRLCLMLLVGAGLFASQLSSDASAVIRNPLLDVARPGEYQGCGQQVKISTDSLAPDHGGKRWLPCEPWVMYHWLPYSEPRLFKALGVGRAVVLRWLRDDQHHTLARLAKRRGKDPMRIANDLAKPWLGKVSNRQYAVLLDRTERTLTQGHLAQHIFFHTFHQPLIAINASRIFGTSAGRYQVQRLLGRSPAQIARSKGRSANRVARATFRVLRDASRRGIASDQTPSSQARRFLSAQRDGLRHWLNSKISKPGFVGRRAHRSNSRKAMLCRLFSGGPLRKHLTDRSERNLG